MFVLDSSVALAWCFEDEATAYSESVLRAIEGGQTATIPALWYFEIANVLALAQVRKRLTATEAEAALGDLASLRPAMDTEELSSVSARARSLAASTGLTAYDAAYLDLAIRKRLPLATLDARLRRAAVSNGVSPFRP